MTVTVRETCDGEAFSSTKTIGEFWPYLTSLPIDPSGSQISGSRMDGESGIEWSWNLIGD